MSSILDDGEVFDLVRDYLVSKNFVETERALMSERTRVVIPDSGISDSETSCNQGVSRLEDMLEKSFVTSFVSGDGGGASGNKKRKRQHLDPSLPTKKENGTPYNKTHHVKTRLVSFDACKDDPHGSAVMPLYQTATFAQPSATSFGAYDYTRSGNPTRAAFERQMAELESGTRAFAFTSGMAALSCASRLAVAGQDIICCDDSYGGTYRLLSKIASRLGVSVRYIDLAGASGPQNLLDALQDNTRLVMLESPTNPMMRICDIAGLAAAAHTKNALLSVDNTMMSPILQRPLELGADLVVQSATKFVSGHSDTMAGVIIVGNEELAKEVYFLQNAEGTGLAPFDCWLLLRGVKTLGVRVEAAQRNAERIASFLKAHPLVTHTYYAALKDAPDQAIHASQASGGGCVVCFRTGSLPLSQHIVSVTRLFKITVSFGSVNSLISLPGAMSHASIPAEVRAAREFPEDLVRLSIGLEDSGDLIADLSNAFSTYQGPPSTSSGAGGSSSSTA